MRLKLLNGDVSKLIKIVILSFCLAIISGHYSEYYQASLFSYIKHLIYFRSLNNIQQTSMGIISKYPGMEYGIINPVHNAQAVLEGAENYLTEKYYPEFMLYKYGNNKLDKKKLIKIVDWFINRYKEEVVYGVRLIRLPYDMDIPGYNLKKPWYSGMAQGHVLVISLAAYDITGEKKYLTFAHKIVRLLDIPIEHGGVKIILPSGVWFEEYAGNCLSGDKYPKVLNGNIFAIDGLFWYWHFNKNSKKYTNLIKSSIKTLDDEILNYKSAFWSYYDLWRPDYADATYHSIHIIQLLRVHNFYAKKFSINTINIGVVADKFNYYQKIPLGYVERLIFQHNRMIIIITFSNMLIFMVAMLMFVKYFRRDK